MSCHPLASHYLPSETTLSEFLRYATKGLHDAEFVISHTRLSFIPFPWGLVGPDIVQLIGDGRCRVTSVICFHLTAFPLPMDPTKISETKRSDVRVVLLKGWRITSSSEMSVLHISAYFFPWLFCFIGPLFMMSHFGGGGEKLLWLTVGWWPFRIVANCNKIVWEKYVFGLLQVTLFVYIALLSPSLFVHRIGVLSSTAVRMNIAGRLGSPMENIMITSLDRHLVISSSVGSSADCVDWMSFSLNLRSHLRRGSTLNAEQLKHSSEDSSWMSNLNKNNINILLHCSLRGVRTYSAHRFLSCWSQIGPLPGDIAQDLQYHFVEFPSTT